MEKKRNRNAIRSVNMIVDAYISLLEQVPADKITVTAIVDQAELNRSTFYAHFGCPEDVHKLMEQRLVDELFNRVRVLDIKGLIKDPTPLLNIVAEMIEENKKLVKLMFARHSSMIWLDRMKEMIIDKLIADTETVDLYADRDMLMVNIRFFVGGYISLCRDHISGKTDIALSELTDILSATIAGGLASGIKN